MASSCTGFLPYKMYGRTNRKLLALKVTIVMVIMLLTTETALCSPRKPFGTPKSSALCPTGKRELLRARLGDLYNPNYMSDDVLDTADQLNSDTADQMYSLAQDKTNMTSLDESDDASIERRRKKQPPQSADSWKCNVKWVWNSLGLEYYPRYYQSAQCTRSTCFFEIFSCRTTIYKMQVLKRKPGACQMFYKGGVPSFEEVWDLKTINIPVACECGN